MALHEAAKEKALQYFEDVIGQAKPDLNTSEGSPVRALLMLPGALVHAALTQDIEALRQLYLGNYEQLSKREMDRLAGNLLQERPPGTLATTTLHLYVSPPTSFQLRPFPYFSNTQGVKYEPTQRFQFEPVDFIEDDNGDFYVQVPVVATEFGPRGRSDTGTIEKFENLPVDADRVTNPEPTTGGEGEATNEEFFQSIQDNLSGPTLNQVGGIINHVVREFPSVQNVRVVTAGDEEMDRDEVWASAVGGQNLDQIGQPVGFNTPVQSLDFNQEVGRVVAPSDTFSSSLEGRRIQLNGENRKYRIIKRVIDDKRAIISGPPVDGTKDGVILDEGPHVMNMSDVYTYFPNLHVQSVTIDPRRTLSVDNPRGKSYLNTFRSKLYYNIDDDGGAIPSDGIIVANEGTQNAQRIEILGVQEDQYGTYFEIPNTILLEFEVGDTLVFYPSGGIEIGEDADITNLPCIYVLEVEKLDPATMQSDETVTRHQGSPYSPPGWRMQVDDPFELFSSRENKTIDLEGGLKQNSNRHIEVTTRVETSKDDHTGFKDVSGSKNIVRVENTSLIGAILGGDTFSSWEYTEGRKATLEYRDVSLQDPGDGYDKILEDSNTTNNSGDVIKITFKSPLNILYFSDVGYRTSEVTYTIFEYDGTSYNKLGEYDASQIAGYGNILEARGSFTFPTKGGGNSYAVTVDFTGTTSLYSHAPDTKNPIESIILDTLPSQHDLEAEVLIRPGTLNGSLVGIKGRYGYIHQNGNALHSPIDVTLEGEASDYETSPFRVTYATHPAIESLQSEVDDRQQRDLCESTLIRSVFPSAIDMTIEYSGGLTSEEMQERINTLLQESVRQSSPGEPTEIDLNNILARIDEEGLVDKLDVQPMIRVTNYLKDGSREVRYMNPDETVKRKFAIYQYHASGADRIDLREVEAGPIFSGRGKIILGGNNPNTQEVLPYEAIYELENQSMDKIAVLRSGYDTQYEHRDWEGVWLTTLDYDPDLEYTDGTLTIPARNRPYIRELLVTKL